MKCFTFWENNKPIRITDLFVGFPVIFSQFGWPIEPKFSQVCYFRHKLWYTKCGPLDNTVYRKCPMALNFMVRQKWIVEVSLSLHYTVYVYTFFVKMHVHNICIHNRCICICTNTFPVVSLVKIKPGRLGWLVRLVSKSLLLIAKWSYDYHFSTKFHSSPRLTYQADRKAL